MDEDEKLAKSLIGHKIVDVVWQDGNPDHDWADHEECIITLDDGRVIRFGGWGYDASGATIQQLPAEGSEQNG